MRVVKGWPGASVAASGLSQARAPGGHFPVLLQRLVQACSGCQREGSRDGTVWRHHAPLSNLLLTGGRGAPSSLHCGRRPRVAPSRGTSPRRYFVFHSGGLELLGLVMVPCGAIAGDRPPWVFSLLGSASTLTRGGAPRSRHVVGSWGPAPHEGEGPPSFPCVWAQASGASRWRHCGTGAPARFWIMFGRAVTLPGAGAPRSRHVAGSWGPTPREGRDLPFALCFVLPPRVQRKELATPPVHTTRKNNPATFAIFAAYGTSHEGSEEQPRRRVYRCCNCCGLERETG
eukprot:Gb_00383 [translate_table: standard]